MIQDKTYVTCNHRRRKLPGYSDIRARHCLLYLMDNKALNSSDQVVQLNSYNTHDACACNDLGWLNIII